MRRPRAERSQRARFNRPSCSAMRRLEQQLVARKCTVAFAEHGLDAAVIMVLKNVAMLRSWVLGSM